MKKIKILLFSIKIEINKILKRKLTLEKSKFKDKK